MQHAHNIRTLTLHCKGEAITDKTQEQSKLVEQWRDSYSQDRWFVSRLRQRRC